MTDSGGSQALLRRHACLEAIAELLSGALVVTCIGGARAEWNHVKRVPDFTTYAMGLASSVGLGLALALPRRAVVAIDGDGAVLMNLSGLATIARTRPANLLHLVFDNECYESSGAGPTHTAAGLDLVAVADAAGYREAKWISSVDAFAAAVAQFLRSPTLTMLAVKVEPSSAAHVGGTPDNLEQKYQFIRHIEKLESIAILNSSLPAHMR